MINLFVFLPPADRIVLTYFIIWCILLFAKILNYQQKKRYNLISFAAMNLNFFFMINKYTNYYK